MTTARYVGFIVTTLIIGNGSSFGQDEALGRLFYTPEQRASLNSRVARTARPLERPVALPRSVSLNGVLTRSDGERTVWIDGRAYHQGANPQDMRVITRREDPAGAEIRLSGVKRRLQMRVGQRVDPASGSTFESYEGSPSLQPSKAQ